MNRQLVDPLPIWLIVVLLGAFMLIAYELGFRFGRWRQRRTPDETESGPTGVLVGSLLGLMAFLLAIATGLAADRFDARRGLVLQEANAIRTTYLRAGYLPPAQGEQVRELLREYTPLRVSTADAATLEAQIARSLEIQTQLWAITEELVRTTENTDLLALYVESVNEIIEVHESRITAGIYARVPETIVLLLLAGSVLALGMVGYANGLSEKRGLISALVVIVALSVVTALVVDLDRPRDGVLQVSQQPLVDLANQIGPPSP
jgi:hypothetical protein